MWTTHSTEPAVQPQQRNGSTHVPAGTGPKQPMLVAKVGRETPTFASEFRDEDFPESSI